jgi:hypothetical protein
MLRRNGGASLDCHLCGITLMDDLDCRERLTDMNERTKQLEDASHSFAVQVRYSFVLDIN